jgi:hypothetical protein
MTGLAIYDMDRTVTRTGTYTPFLLHCALRRRPWRLLLLPLVLLSMLAYVARLIDRAKLKDQSPPAPRPAHRSARAQTASRQFRRPAGRDEHPPRRSPRNRP